MKEIQIKNAKKLASRLREHFGKRFISGNYSVTNSTISVYVVNNTPGLIIRKDIQASGVSKWTSEDFIDFERKCKEELK